MISINDAMDILNGGEQIPSEQRTELRSLIVTMEAGKNHAARTATHMRNHCRKGFIQGSVIDQELAQIEAHASEVTR